MRQERGFSLIEVLIAGTIFAVGMLALAGLQYTSMYSIRAGDKRVAATNLVEQALEAARNQGINTFNLAEYSTTGYDLDILGNNAAGTEDAMFQRTVTVNGNIVKAVVSWNVKGEVKNVSSATLVY